MKYIFDDLSLYFEKLVIKDFSIFFDDEGSGIIHDYSALMEIDEQNFQLYTINLSNGRYLIRVDPDSAFWVSYD